MVKLKKRCDEDLSSQSSIDDHSDSVVSGSTDNNNNNSSRDTKRLNPYEAFIKRHPEITIIDHGDGTYGFINK